MYNPQLSRREVFKQSGKTALGLVGLLSGFGSPIEGATNHGYDCKTDVPRAIRRLDDLEKSEGPETMLLWVVRYSTTVPEEYFRCMVEGIQEQSNGKYEFVRLGIFDNKLHYLARKVKRKTF